MDNRLNKQPPGLYLFWNASYSESLVTLGNGNHYNLERKGIRKSSSMSIYDTDYTFVWLPKEFSFYED